MSACNHKAAELADAIVARFEREHPALATDFARPRLRLIAIAEAGMAFARCEARCRGTVIRDEYARCIHERARQWQKGPRFGKAERV